MVWHGAPNCFDGVDEMIVLAMKNVGDAYKNKTGEELEIFHL